LTTGRKSPELANLIAELALDRKAEDVVVLDLRELSSVTDYFVLCTGRSDVHVRAIVERIEKGAEMRGERPFAREGIAHANWALLDYGDVVVHVFQPQTRAFYALERLWSRAPRWTTTSSSAIEAGRP
jgi:ribosome-associated protein